MQNPSHSKREYILFFHKKFHIGNINILRFTLNNVNHFRR